MRGRGGAFVRAFVRSFNCSFVRSFVRSFNCSFVRSFVVRLLCVRCGAYVREGRGRQGKTAEENGGGE